MCAKNSFITAFIQEKLDCSGWLIDWEIIRTCLQHTTTYKCPRSHCVAITKQYIHAHLEQEANQTNSRLKQWGGLGPCSGALNQQIRKLSAFVKLHAALQGQSNQESHNKLRLGVRIKNRKVKTPQCGSQSVLHMCRYAPSAVSCTQESHCIKTACSHGAVTPCDRVNLTPCMPKQETPVRLKKGQGAPGTALGNKAETNVTKASLVTSVCTLEQSRHC